MKRIITNIIIAIIFLTGLSILLYPAVSDYVNELHSSKAIVDYDNILNSLPKEDYEHELQAAKEYNVYLTRFANLSEAAVTEEKRSDSPYWSLLDIGSASIMGSIRIPSIKVNLPIYHGTGEEVLQIGAGHYLGSSLPIGGESTHAILTGHRGLPSAKLFTDLDRLETGDIFYIKVLGDILEYEIDQIETVLPSELDSLSITPGEDYVTLVTCTPYGINSHRMLVRGTRIPYDGKYEEEVKMKPVPKNTDLPESERGNGFTTKQWILFAAAVFAAAILAGLLLPGKKSGKKENGSGDEAAEGKKKKLSKNSRTEKKEGSHEKKE